MYSRTCHIHVPIHVITVRDARCDCFNCNLIALIKVQWERSMNPLFTTGFLAESRPSAAEAKRSISFRRAREKASVTHGNFVKNKTFTKIVILKACYSMTSSKNVKLIQKKKFFLSGRSFKDRLLGKRGICVSRWTIGIVTILYSRRAIRDLQRAKWDIKVLRDILGLATTDLHTL